MPQTVPNRRLLVRREQLAVAAMIVVWSALAAGGWWAFAAYSFQSEPDAGATVATTWPADSTLPRAGGRNALLVFLHPKCPCSQATVSELERLLAPLADGPTGMPQVIVVGSTPSAPDDGWTAAPLLERSRRLPGATIVVDRGGVETARFGATASGTVMLYDVAGRRTYRGGVTASRGHEGRSSGGDVLANLLAGGADEATAFPTFGCRLIAADRCAAPDATKQ